MNNTVSSDILPSAATQLVFLKLGGSLITDKLRPRTPRMDTLTRLANEISFAIEKNKNLRLILGHGAGSFAHIPAKKYGTRHGVKTPEEWRGFAEVWREAAALNRLVMDALYAANLPTISLPPSAGITARDGRVASWDILPLQAALQAGLLPVIFGDVIFDEVRGGSILSTEDLFGYLAGHLHPQRILLAGMEPGVWMDYPKCTRLIPEIKPDNYEEVSRHLAGSNATDVTGGMVSKVLQSLALVQDNPGLEVLIFSGEEAGMVERVLSGERAGTIISVDE